MRSAPEELALETSVLGKSCGRVVNVVRSMLVKVRHPEIRPTDKTRGPRWQELLTEGHGGACHRGFRAREVKE
jgi:hypothetical protein